MEREQAESAVTLSALVVAGMFAYRKAVEPKIPQGTPSKGFIEDYRAVFGSGPPLDWSQFLKAAGSLYIVVAIIAAGSPEIGGSLALLIGTGAVLGNGIALSRDLHQTNSETGTVERAADVGSFEAFAKPGGLSTLPQSAAPGQPLPTLGR